MRSYIFRKDFQHRYNSAFQQYVIDAFYGGDVLIGDDLMQKRKHVVVDEEEEAEEE